MNAKNTIVTILAVIGGIALVGAGVAYLGKRVIAGIGIGTPMLKNFTWLREIRNGVLVPIGISGKLFIPIVNKNAFAIPTPRFDGNILYQGKFPLANVVIDNPVTLSAGGETTLVANVNIDFEKLSTSLVNIFKGGLSLPSLWLKGELKAAGVQIPVNQNIQII